MIKKFSSLVREGRYDDDIRRHGGVGRWLEGRIEDDPYLKEVTAPFLRGIDPTIRLANAIDMLSDFDKRQVYDAVVRRMEATNESAQAQAQSGGRNVFKSFLKCITSLGLSRVNKVARPGQLIYFETHECADDMVAQSLNRFRSLSAIHTARPSGSMVRMYFGIDGDLRLSYGISGPNGQSELGAFALGKGAFKWLQELASPSAAQLRSDLFPVHWDDMLLLRKVFKFMTEYPIGEKGKAQPLFEASTLCFSYYGVSKWDNGVIDAGEYANIKTNLKTRLTTMPWHDRILVRVSADSFNLSICFKVK